jgi:hypothetical protein
MWKLTCRFTTSTSPRAEVVWNRRFPRGEVDVADNTDVHYEDHVAIARNEDDVGEYFYWWWR